MSPLRASRGLSVVFGTFRLLITTCLLGVGFEVGAASPLASLNWTNNTLTVDFPGLPGGPLQIFYLEAFLKPGANTRSWGETKLSHTTRLLESAKEGRLLRFKTRVEPSIDVLHEVESVEDGLWMNFEFRNTADSASDIQWFQPACIRVDGFTARDQKGYTARSFIFTTSGLSILDALQRRTDALYRGGQVYVPAGVASSDANPRPICRDRPVNGLIGCYSNDGRWLLAVASDRTHELFEGVYVCLHSDPHIGGLKAREVKRLRQKLYLVPNDVDALLTRYRKDFPDSMRVW